MRLEHYQLASIIAMQVTCGERLEIAENGNWHVVASAAAQLEKMHAGKQVNLAEICAALSSVHEQIAAVNRKIALKIDIALAVVEALRLGVLVLDMPQPVWIGIDLGSGDSYSVKWQGGHYA